MGTCDDFLKERIEFIKSQIIAIETAMLELQTGLIQSYTLDTGQTRQTVTKADISKMQDLLDGLYNQLSVFCARYGGGGTVNAGLDW